MKKAIEAVGQFELLGDLVSVEPYGSGHINDTYAATVDQSGRRVRYILQRVNHEIFKNPAGLMANVSRVCSHIRSKLIASGVPDASRRALTLVPTQQGESFYTDSEGGCWRVYLFIERATGHDVVKHVPQAYEAAKAFGAFQGMLADLPDDPLHETIPDFHNTPKRFVNFRSALDADAHNRAAQAHDEIEWVLQHAGLATALTDLKASGIIPERPVTHNDTKLNNVLLDDKSNEAVCVIDLDTVMPGLAGYDFGDLVRTSTSPVGEDAQDLSKVFVQLDMFDALVRGYLSSMREVLTVAEKESLPLAAQVMTFECGLRFLTDFLQGDIYFKTHRVGHNLDRCRAQFKLVQSMQEQMAGLVEIVSKA